MDSDGYECIDYANIYLDLLNIIEEDDGYLTPSDGYLTPSSTSPPPLPPKSPKVRASASNHLDLPIPISNGEDGFKEDGFKGDMPPFKIIHPLAFSKPERGVYFPLSKHLEEGDVISNLLKRKENEGESHQCGIPFSR